MSEINVLTSSPSNVTGLLQEIDILSIDFHKNNQMAEEDETEESGLGTLLSQPKVVMITNPDEYKSSCPQSRVTSSASSP